MTDQQILALAGRCALPFAWATDRLHLFGMIAFHRPAGC